MNKKRPRQEGETQGDIVTLHIKASKIENELVSRALAIVLEHWLLFDWGWSIDNIKSRVPRLQEDFVKCELRYLQNNHGKTFSQEEKFQQSNAIRELLTQHVHDVDDRIFEEIFDSLANVQWDRILPPGITTRNCKGITFIQANTAIRDLYELHFKRLTIKIECTCIGKLEEVYQYYQKNHQMVVLYFKSQQERWQNHYGPIIVYQLVTYQQFRKVMERIDLVLFSWSLIPDMFQRERSEFYRKGHLSPDNYEDEFLLEILELRDRLKKFGERTKHLQLFLKFYQMESWMALMSDYLKSALQGLSARLKSNLTDFELGIDVPLQLGAARCLIHDFCNNWFIEALRAGHIICKGLLEPVGGSETRRMVHYQKVWDKLSDHDELSNRLVDYITLSNLFSDMNQMHPPMLINNDSISDMMEYQKHLKFGFTKNDSAYHILSNFYLSKCDHQHAIIMYAGITRAPAFAGSFSSGTFPNQNWKTNIKKLHNVANELQSITQRQQMIQLYCIDVLTLSKQYGKESKGKEDWNNLPYPVRSLIMLKANLLEDLVCFAEKYFAQQFTQSKKSLEAKKGHALSEYFIDLFLEAKTAIDSYLPDWKMNHILAECSQFPDSDYVFSADTNINMYIHPLFDHVLLSNNYYSIESIRYLSQLRYLHLYRSMLPSEEEINDDYRVYKFVQLWKLSCEKALSSIHGAERSSDEDEIIHQLQAVGFILLAQTYRFLNRSRFGVLHEDAYEWILNCEEDETHSTDNNECKVTGDVDVDVDGDEDDDTISAKCIYSETLLNNWARQLNVLVATSSDYQTNVEQIRWDVPNQSKAIAFQMSKVKLLNHLLGVNFQLRSIQYPEDSKLFKSQEKFYFSCKRLIEFLDKKLPPLLSIAIEQESAVELSIFQYYEELLYWLNKATMTVLLRCEVRSMVQQKQRPSKNEDSNDEEPMSSYDIASSQEAETTRLMKPCRFVIDMLMKFPEYRQASEEITGSSNDSITKEQILAYNEAQRFTKHEIDKVFLLLSENLSKCL